MPNAMPNVQKTAMAESSRMSFRLLSHSTPKADNTEKTAAERIGEIPIYNPIPMPPKRSMCQPAADKYQTPGNDVCTDNSTDNACQQAADQGMLKESIL